MHLPHDRTQEVNVAGVKVKVLQVPQVEAVLNALGAEGWEVVSIAAAATNSSSRAVPWFTLKRETTT